MKKNCFEPESCLIWCPVFVHIYAERPASLFLFTTLFDEIISALPKW